mmetsp:Transcript_11633/g.24125  ORF Transcript_11633/g.24125 Transcript_11633/m.24125 type:complete len:91 (+) Transcript_11633:15-287(+)
MPHRWKMTKTTEVLRMSFILTKRFLLLHFIASRKISRKKETTIPTLCNSSNSIELDSRVFIGIARKKCYVFFGLFSKSHHTLTKIALISI